MKGLRITSLMCGVVAGFTKSELTEIRYRLGAGSDPWAATDPINLPVLDSAINAELGIEEMVLDAVTVTYSRLSSKMTALHRALSSSMKREGSDITVGLPEVGKPRKNGMFANVTVRFPFSDGQSISVVFHAPDGDPATVDTDDMLISFRWMLNRRDVTQWMSPEADDDKLVDISLATLGKRVAQLIEVNTEKFTARQAERDAAQKALAAAQEKNIDLESALADFEETIPKLERAAEVKLEATKAVQSKIDAANAKKEALAKQLEQLRAESEAVPEADKLEGGLLSKIEQVGLSLIQFMVLFISGNYSAKYRSESAIKMGIGGDAFEGARGELNTGGVYLSNNKLTAAGENILNAILGTDSSSGWSFFRAQVEELWRKGTDFIAGTAEVVAKKLVGVQETDKALFERWLKAFPVDNTIDGWNELRRSVGSSISTIYKIDSGIERGYNRALFVSNFTNKIKTRHKNGQYEAVDRVLDFIEAYNDMAAKPVISGANKIWALRTSAKSPFTEKVGAEYFDWSQEATETLLVSDYRDRIETVLWLVSDYSGHTSDEFMRDNVKGVLAGAANNLIKATSSSATKEDFSRAQGALDRAVSMIDRWVEQGGERASALRDIDLAKRLDNTSKINALENHLALAESDEGIGKAWDQLFEMALGFYPE